MIEIDESLLVRLAGARAFGQGLHCFAEGRVHDVVTTDRITNAIVREGRQHTVRLRYTYRMMEGDCDCAVSSGIEFCQHCVAVALHLQEQETPAKSIDKRAALRRIRRYLSGLTHEELLDEFLERVKQDREDLGNAFHAAVKTEIASRRDALKRNAAAGIDREKTRRVLAQIEEDLSAQ